MLIKSNPDATYKAFTAALDACEDFVRFEESNSDVILDNSCTDIRKNDLHQQKIIMINNTFVQGNFNRIVNEKNSELDCYKKAKLSPHIKQLRSKLRRILLKAASNYAINVIAAITAPLIINFFMRLRN